MLDEQQLPEGEQYREILLLLPVYGAWSSASERQLTLPGFPAIAFRSPHYVQENIIAHLRLNERHDVDGKRVLFIEEIQSDWAQRGRLDGFTTTPKAPSLIEWMRSNVGDKPRVEDLRRYQLYLKLGDPVTGPLSKGVPPAPFVMRTASWIRLAMKRAIVEAVGGGCDFVAWTTGDQQNARYPGRGIKQRRGMKVFYDEIVPQTTNKLLVRLGGERVRPIHFAMKRRRLAVGIQPGFAITSALTERVNGGLPLWG